MKTIILITLFASSLYAACSGSSPSWTAASAGRSDLSDCLTAASSGDTITVPSGSATWATSLTFPSDKDLTVVGAGKTLTLITCTGECLTIPNGRTIDLSGFSFTFGSEIVLLGRINVAVAGKQHRIHHNKFTHASWGQILYQGEGNCNSSTQVHPTSLIDNNEFINTRVHIQGTACIVTDGPAEDYLWTQDPRPNAPTGAWPNVVYIEDNTFHSTSASMINFIDANSGARYVVRYNTVSAETGVSRPYVESHGVQGTNRAVQWIEVYKNTVTDTGDDNYFGQMYMRSGSGVIWGLRSPATADIMRIDNQRSCITKPGSGLCDGSNSDGWDGNTGGMSGYPCRDQIGRYKDTSFWTRGGAYTGQDFTPVYFWDNIKGASTQDVPELNGACAAMETHIVQNREWYTQDTSFDGTEGVGVGAIASRPATCTTGVSYWATDEGTWNSRQVGADGQLYKCTSTNTWTLYYTPYAYPHPLQGEATTFPTTLGPGTWRITVK
jgi:hypothetical protein